MNEKDLFNELLKNRPEVEENPVTIGEGRTRKFLVPKWMTGLPEDKYVQSVTRFFKSSGIDIPVQIWYDLVVLRLDSIEDRPRCKAPGCNNPVEYEGALYKGRGYFDTCCRACAGSLNRSQYINTEEMNQKRSATLLGKKKSDTHRANIARCKTGTKASPETRKKLSESRHQYYLTVDLDEWSNSYFKSTTNGVLKKSHFKRGWIYLSKSSKEVYYMSSWEEEIYKILDNDPDVKVVSNSPDRIPYYSHIDEKDHVYIPDIYVELVDGRKFILEVKPRYQLLLDEVKLKISAGLKFYSESEVTYKVVTEDELGDLRSSNSILSII